MSRKQPGILTVANGNRNFRRLDKLVRQFAAGFLSSLLVFQPALLQAQQVTPDVSAPVINQPSIGVAPNEKNIPLVDIVTPNAQGLSHNKYDSFNVGTPGLILNNHNAETGTSLLGGITPGNPNLKNSGPATVILNEVTKANRSSLEGQVEVFGGRADVIIANPNGITCNGCGFINSPRATLTTGTPDIDATGRLSGFTVNGGNITFGEKGGNFAAGNGSVDLFDVVSRSIKVDGKIYGKDLRLTAGRNKFDYATREAKALEAISGTPEYAIDGSALGAMQADRIKIVVTEKGSGVRMSNKLAATAGELSLSADGKLSLGDVSGREGVTLTSTEKITAKAVTSPKRVVVKADKGITLQTVSGDGDGSVELGSGSGLLSIAGDAKSGGTFTLASNGGVSLQSVEAGVSVIEATSGNIDIKGETKVADLVITATTGSITSRALTSFNNMTLTAGLDLNTSGSDIAAAGKLSASARSITSGAIASGVNIAATHASTQKVPIFGAVSDLTLVATAGNISSTLLFSGRAANLNAANINADGIKSRGDINVTGIATVKGQVLGGANVSISGATLHSGDIYSGIDFAATDANGGKIKLGSSGNLTLTAASASPTGSGVITAGALVAAGSLTVTAKEITADRVKAQGDIALGGNLKVSTEILGASNIALTGTTIKTGIIASGVDLAATDGSPNKKIILGSNGDLTINASGGSLTAAGMLVAGKLTSTAASLSSDTITARRDITLNGDVNVRDQIQGGYNVRINGQNVTAGLVASGVDFVATAASSSGAIIVGPSDGVTTAGDIAINATSSGVVKTSALLSAGLLDVTASSLTAQNITGHNNIRIAANTNVSGQLLGGSNVVIDGKSISIGTLISGVDFAAIAAGGDIKLAKSGDLTINAVSGTVKTTAMLSAGNLNAAAAIINATNITGHKKVSLAGNTNVNDQILGGNIVRISGQSVNAGLIVSGVDFAATSASSSGSIVVGPAGDLVINAASGSVNATALLSAGLLDVTAASFTAQNVTGHKSVRIAANTNVNGQIQGGSDVSITGPKIKAGAVISGVDFAATANSPSGDIVLSATGTPSTAGGATVAGVPVTSANLALNATSGSIDVGSLLSAGNLTGKAAQNINAHAVSHQALNLTAGNTIMLSGQSLSGSDLVLKAGSISADTLVSGVDFAAAEASPDGSLILKQNTAVGVPTSAMTLDATQGSITAKNLTSGGKLSAHATHDIAYNTVLSFGSASFAADQGSISFDKTTRAAGDITLTTKSVDFSGNRANSLATAKSLIINADTATFAGSNYTWGGLGLNLSGNADFTGTTLNAITGNGGSGNINVKAAGITQSNTSALLAQNDLTLSVASLSNPGQIAAGHNLTFNIASDLTNTPTGLIYAGNDARMYVAGNLLNDQGAILAGHDLAIAANTNNAKNQSVTNVSGLIRGENDVSIFSDNLTNKRLTKPIWENVFISSGVLSAFELNPDVADEPFAHLFTRMKDTGDGPEEHNSRLYKNMPSQLWSDYKDRLWSQSKLVNGTSYHAFTWTSEKGPNRAGRIEDWIAARAPRDTNGNLVIDPNNPSRFFILNLLDDEGSRDNDPSVAYTWDETSNISQAIREDRFTAALAPESLIRAGNNLNVEATTLNNAFSSIEAGGDATLKGSVLNNEGVTLNRTTTTTCNAQGSCEAFDANGNRDPSNDIAKGTSNLSKVEAIGGAAGNIHAAGNMDVSDFGIVNNTSAPGSITGGAKLATTSTPGDPTAALTGLTAGAALFTPNAAFAALQASAGLFTATGPLTAGNSASLSPSVVASPSTLFAETLRVNGAALAALSKPNSGGFGGTVPGQIFLYETRATFLDVSKFYGSGYFINRIGYKPEHEIPFLGDAYFENQLIDMQLRQLVGQGLGKGSFIPGSDAIEQMKLLLDNGIEYAKANNLKIGEQLSSEQAAALTTSVVLYQKKIVQGIEVLAPVVYLTKADKVNLTVAGALISGSSLNMNVGNINNSGAIAAKTDLKLAGTNIRANGGSFVAGKNLQLKSAGDLTLNAQSLTLGGANVVNPSAGVEAGGNATLAANNNLKIQGAQVNAGGDAALSGKNVTLDVVKVDNGGSTTAGGQQNATGARINAGGNLTIAADDNVDIIGSAAKAGGSLDVTAQNGSVNVVTTDLARATDDGYAKITSRQQQQSQLSSGAGTTVKAGDDILVSGSSINAKGDVKLDAVDDVHITVAQEQAATKFGKDKLSETTHQGSQIKSGGSVSVTAGGGSTAGVQSDANASHDINIVGSSIAADKKVDLKAAGDVTIADARDSATIDVATKTKKSGLFGKSSSSTRHRETETTEGSSISGETGVDITSGDDTIIAASKVQAGTEENKADLNIITGGDLVVAAGQDAAEESASGKSKGFLSKGSSKRYRYDQTTVGSELGASGNIKLDAGGNATITGSQVLAKESIDIEGDNVSIIGAQENHARDEQRKKSGLGAGSGGGFVSIWGKEKKDVQQSLTLNSPSLLSAGKDVAVTARETDINMLGSHIDAGQDITLDAKRDVNILPGAENSSAFEQEKKSGFGLSFSSGGGGASIGIGFGSSTDKTSQSSETNAVSSLTAGRDLTIISGRDTNIQAAQVAAERDAKIKAANNVNLLSAQDKSNYEEVHEKLFAGVTLSVSSSLVSAVSNTVAAASKIGDGSASKSVAMGTVAAINAYTALDTLSRFQQNLDATTLANLKNGKGNELVNASLTLGFQYSKDTASGSSSNPVPTVVRGGNSVIIEAISGDLTGRGARIVAGYDAAGKPNGKDGDITLIAGKDINLTSAQATTDNKSKNVSAGVAVSILPTAPGASFNFATGKSNGSTLTQMNSHVDGTGNVLVQSGRDTVLKGATVTGNSVIVDVGRDLSIESQLDLARQKASQTSVGGGIGSQGNGINGSYQKADGDTAVVTEQSGIHAGTGGFDITVNGKTSVVGGLITSEANPAQNKLQTGTLETSDIDTHSKWKADTYGGGLTLTGIPSVAPGMHEGESKTGQALTAIAPGRIIITDPAKQQQNLDDLRRDTNNTNTSLPGLPELQSILREQLKTQTLIEDAQAKAAKIIGDKAGQFEREAKERKDPEAEAFWAEGGPGRAALHALSQGLLGGANDVSGMIKGALGGATSSLLAPKIKELVEDMTAGANIADPKLREQLVNSVASSIIQGIGAGLGGTAGASAAGNVFYNNYLNHEQLDEALANRKALVKCLNNDACTAADKNKMLAEDQKFMKLSADNTAALVTVCAAGPSDACSAKVRDLLEFVNAMDKASIAGTDPYFDANGFSKKQSVFDYDRLLASHMRGVADGTISSSQAIANFTVDLSKKEGGVNAFLDTLGVVGGVGVCASGAGTAACVAGVVTALASANHLTSSGNQALTGMETKTLLVVGLMASGLSQADAERYQFYVDMGIIVADVAVGGGKAVLRYNAERVAKLSTRDQAIIREVAVPAPQPVALVRGKSGDWNKLANKPKPNTKYEFENGYQYHIDGEGRTAEVSAELQWDPWDRNKYQQVVAGGDCRQSTDCGGHLLASMFGGPGEGINLVPMDVTLNGPSGAWYQLEQTWKNALQKGQKVEVQIKPIYTGSSKRPDNFSVQFAINGIPDRPQIIKNSPTGK